MIFRYYVEQYINNTFGSSTTPEISISYIIISGTTTWGQLDNAVRRAFKQHVARLDPGGGLGLGNEKLTMPNGINVKVTDIILNWTIFIFISFWIFCKKYC